MSTTARPSLLRGQTMPSYLPAGPGGVTSLPASLEDAVAALQFPQGSFDAVRHVLADESKVVGPHSTSTSTSTSTTTSAALCSSATSPLPTPKPSPPSIVGAAIPRNGAVSSKRLQVTMSLDSQPNQHVLTAPLGPSFSSECITIAAKRGSVLFIVADRWDSETDCHYEWKINFDRDADMSRIQANFNHGLLKVTVPRMRTYA